MAAVLSNNMNDIKSVSFFMEECRRMGLKVLGPDVNESFYKFTVNEQYQIRFGMGAIKGVGAPAVETIVQNRKEATYKSIFDLAKKIDLRAANKKAFESLALAGGFDGFANTHRAQYFHIEGEGITFLERAIRYGSKFQENQNSAQVSLFGDASEVQIAEPIVPPCEEWSTMEKLSREREVVGIYISGHPLDDFKYTIQNYCSTFETLKNPQNIIGKTLLFGGIVTKADHRTTKANKGWGIFQIEGYDEHYEFKIFDKAYLDFRNVLSPNQFVLIKANIKNGWINQETGKPGDPRVEVTDVLQLQDTLGKLCKKLIIKIDIQELSQNTIKQLSELFAQNKGEHQIVFEISEIEKVKKQIEIALKTPEENLENDEEITITENNSEIEFIEENKVINQILIPSRKTKVKISNELLSELEKMQVKFKLN
jgi:DNA polymerase-3 subunit alpha